MDEYHQYRVERPHMERVHTTRKNRTFTGESADKMVEKENVWDTYGWN